MKYVITLCLLILLYTSGRTQEKKPAVSFELSGTLTTTPVYNIQGTDTAFKQSLVTSLAAKCILGPGFTVQYSPYFVMGGTAPGLYMQVLTTGFEQYDKPTLNIDTYYSHYFFTGNSSVPYSPVNNEVYLSLSYKKPWLRPLLSSSIGFGKDQNNTMQTSVNIAGGVVHSFELKNKNSSYGEISPAVVLNTGLNPVYSFLTNTRYVTQSNTILKTNRGRGRGNGSTGGGTTTTTSTTTTNIFQANNIELNLYSSFEKGHFSIVPAGSIFIPLHATESLFGYWQLKFAWNI